MKLRTAIILVVVLLLLSGIGFFAFEVNRFATRTMPNAYAVEWVGGIVVDYLHQNEDGWPQSWEDLRPAYERCVTLVGHRPYTLEELQSRVRIRWDVDVEAVRQRQTPPDDLIVLSDGGHEHWGGYEPNEMVHRYLTTPKAR